MTATRVTDAPATRADVERLSALITALEERLAAAEAPAVEQAPRAEPPLPSPFAPHPPIEEV